MKKKEIIKFLNENWEKLIVNYNHNYVKAFINLHDLLYEKLNEVYDRLSFHNYLESSKRISHPPSNIIESLCFCDKIMYKTGKAFHFTIKPCNECKYVYCVSFNSKGELIYNKHVKGNCEYTQYYDEDGNILTTKIRGI